MFDSILCVTPNHFICSYSFREYRNVEPPLLQFLTADSTFANTWTIIKHIPNTGTQAEYQLVDRHCASSHFK